MISTPTPTLRDLRGNLLLQIRAQRILDANDQVLAVLENRTALTPQGALLGSVTPQGRYVEGAPSELVVVVEQLRDATGRMVGRFEHANMAERGLLALVYDQLVRGNTEVPRNAPKTGR